MKEVEAKILDIDAKRVKTTLAKLGAKKIYDGNMQTLHFDFSDGSIIKSKNVLRLRIEQNKAEVTYKKVSTSSTAKTAEEFTVDVSNSETMQVILENLGLSVVEDLTKHRTSYILSGARFDIDRYQGRFAFIPEFMEIESANEQEIHRYAALLGFKPEQCLPWSTKDLVSHYSKD